MFKFIKNIAITRIKHFGKIQFWQFWLLKFVTIFLKYLKFLKKMPITNITFYIKCY